MQRTIKFRGKRIDNGEWVYGSLINNAFFKDADKSACCYILDTDKLEYDCWEDIAEYIDEFEVIPETIGQYTGLKDSKENEIWEDDIISDGERRWHITWQHLNARFGYIYKSKSNGDTFDGRLPAHTGIQEYLMKKVIVIGNIHDNKELLTTK